MAATAVTVKYRRRKVFAVRDFPVGCGPTVLPVAGWKRPAEDSLAVPPPPPVAAAATVPVLPLKEPKVEPVESGGVAKGTNLELPNGPKPPEVAPETSKGGLVAEPAFVKMTVQVNQKRCYPMFHPPPKRRKVSCVRDYPAGCGPNAPVLLRGEGLEVIAASNVRDGEKFPLQAVQVDAFVGAASVQKVGMKSEQGDSEQIHGDLKGNSSEAQRKPASDHLNSKDMDSGKKLTVKKQLVVEGTIKVNSTERSKGAAKSNGAKSQFGSEIVKEGKQSVGQVVERGLVKYESEVGKRQAATSQTEGSSGLVVHGDRMVVQALVAASNCPWSQGRKPGGFSSHSVTPRSNVKKGRKSVSNTAVRGASIVRHIDIL